MRGGQGPTVSRPVVSWTCSSGRTWQTQPPAGHCCCSSPSSSLPSPKSREASAVPAETTMSPEPLPFPKFLQRLPAMSQCSPPASRDPAGGAEAVHESELAGAGDCGQPWGARHHPSGWGSRGPTRDWPCGIGDPQGGWLRDTSNHVPELPFSTRHGLALVGFSLVGS